DDFFNQVALYGLRWKIEQPTIAQGAPQLEIFAVRPHQRHGRAGGPADMQLVLRYVDRAPHLLRDQAALVGEAFHRGEEPPGCIDPARRQFVVRPLAGEQRPAATDPGAVKSSSILVLTISIAVVAMPSGA